MFLLHFLTATAGAVNGSRRQPKEISQPHIITSSHCHPVLHRYYVDDPSHGTAGGVVRDSSDREIAGKLELLKVGDLPWNILCETLCMRPQAGGSGPAGGLLALLAYSLPACLPAEHLLLGSGAHMASGPSCGSMRIH